MKDTEQETKRGAGISRPCPICGKEREERWRPFCSKRCADVDLNRWLTGRYAIPVVEEDDDEDGSSLPEDGQPDGPLQ